MSASPRSTTRNPASRDPPRACRHPALAVRRDLGGDVSHPGLRLRQRRAVRSALQRQRAGLSSIRASPIRPSTCSRTRMAALEGAEAARATATGMAAVHDCAGRPGQGRRPRRRGARRCSAPAAGWSRTCCRASASPRRWSTDSISTSGAARCGPTPRCSSWKARPIRRWRCSTSRRSPSIAHDAGARLVVDNVFATPIFQSPLALGADFVVYSATKHIDGQGRCLGGIILASEKLIQDHIHNLLRQTGPGDVAVQRLGVAQGPGDAAAAGRAPDRERGKIADLLAGHPEDHPADLSGPRRPPAGRDRQEADARRLEPHRLRGQGRQARRVPLPQRAGPRAHLQQSRRRQEPDHPSGDDDPPAPHTGRRAPSSASPTGWCGSRSGSSTSTTSPPTSPPRWRRRSLLLSPDFFPPSPTSGRVG